MSKTKDTHRVIVEPSAGEAVAFVMEVTKSIICEAAARSGACHVALAGGTTPHLLYQQLARSAMTGEVPWRQVQVFFGDERDVPHDHIESNYHMVQRALLDHVPIPPSHVHPMQADADDLDAASAEYENTIRQIVPAGDDGVPRFDLILLGIGANGHTASLFATTEVLDEREKLVSAYFVPVLGRRRMTFTYPLINAARNVLFLVSGQDKAEVMADILSGDADRCRAYPAGRVEPTGGTLMFVLDADAARDTDLRPR